MNVKDLGEGCILINQDENEPYQEMLDRIMDDFLTPSWDSHGDIECDDNFNNLDDFYIQADDDSAEGREFIALSNWDDVDAFKNKIQNECLNLYKESAWFLDIDTNRLGGKNVRLYRKKNSKHWSVRVSYDPSLDWRNPWL